MKHRSLKEWSIRLALLLLGLTVAHLGVTLFLQSNLGSDPFSVLVQGISVRTGISFGIVHIAVTCTLMLIMLITTPGLCPSRNRGLRLLRRPDHRSVHPAARRLDP